MIELQCERCGKRFVLVDSWEGKKIDCQCGAALTVPSPERSRALARLVMKVINSFQVMPAVTTRVVCLHSGQSVWDFSDVMVELLREAGAQTYLCSGESEIERAKSAVRETIESNPALDRGAAYTGYSTTPYTKDNHTITAMKDSMREVKSAGRLPEKVVIIPLEGAYPDWKRFAMEKTVELRGGSVEQPSTLWDWSRQ